MSTTVPLSVTSAGFSSARTSRPPTRTAATMRTAIRTPNRFLFMVCLLLLMGTLRGDGWACMCRRSRESQASPVTFGRGAAVGQRLYSIPSVMTPRDDLRRLLRWGGFAIWAVVGLPVLFSVLGSPSRERLSTPLSAWAASFVLFGVALALNTSQRHRDDRTASLALAAGQSAAAFCLMALPPCFGLEGALLVLVAFQLGGLLSHRAAVTWVSVQSLGLIAIMWVHWGWHWGVVLAGAYLPFQLIAYATTSLLAREVVARERLSAVNTELEATRGLLAQSVRVAERSRIARDLHDLLGHHLTGLS